MPKMNNLLKNEKQNEHPRSHIKSQVEKQKHKAKEGERENSVILVPGRPIVEENGAFDLWVQQATKKGSANRV